MSECADRRRVALISHAYLEGYVGTLTALARKVDLRVVVPDRHPVRTTSDSALTARGQPFALVRYPLYRILGQRSSTRWMLGTADLGFRRSVPDIVHVVNERHSLIVLQALAARRLWAPRARAVVFVWENQRVGLLRERFTVPLGRWAARRVDFFLIASTRARDLLEQDGVPRERIAMAPPVGVDTTTFRPPLSAERQATRRALGIGDDEFVVGYVGRFVAEKGLHDAAAAVALLRGDQAVGGRIRWLLVGGGPLETEVPQWQRTGLPIVRVGVQRQEDTARFYQAMDALLVPSRTTPQWAEQFGRVLIEAMACGTPVIGSDSGAIPEVIGNAGLVVPERNPEALASAIRTLATEPELRHALSDRGRDRVTRGYSNAAIADQITGAYDAACALPPRRRS